MNPHYRDTQLKLIGTSFLSCLGSLTRIKKVCSYHSVVIVFQMSELTSSLRVLEPKYMVEIMKQQHIDFRERSLKTWGG